MKPIIGIVGRNDNKTYVNDEIRIAVIKCGGIPILILPTQKIKLNTNSHIDSMTHVEKQDLIKVLNLCNGIIMPGGIDSYEYDKFICEYAIKSNIPILGICLGMQVMSYYNTDYSLEENDELGINHNKKDAKYVHHIYTRPNSILNKILGNTIRVNSRHNYHIMHTGCYIITAISEDGLVEAIEYPYNSFNVGIQWHPESMIDYDDKEYKLIKTFIEYSKKRCL